MALAFVELSVIAKLVKAGDDRTSLTAGQYLQVRHGAISDPTIMLQEQVPQGKKWDVRVYVSIDEMDA